MSTKRGTLQLVTSIIVVASCKSKVKTPVITASVTVEFAGTTHGIATLSIAG
ncbi:MAG: hypothetical protein LBE09_01695 [Christensenellaceae bacterium]|nr:hypothetical protein [Christensenellaceae bacterium]